MPHTDHTHDDPLGILKLEHEAALKQLERLQNAADSIQANGFSAEAFEIIAKVGGFISTTLKLHDEKEEKILFPLIETHISGKTRPYHDEHRDLWKYFGELMKFVKDVEEGRLHGLSIREFVLCAQQLVTHLTNHIAKEEEMLFPLIMTVLPPEEILALRQKLEETGSPNP